MTLQHELLATIQDVPDFPKPGILFKDICPLLANPALLRRVIRVMAEDAWDRKADVIVGIESRGFMLGVPLALELGLSFMPARKKGKLPGKVVSQRYDLEYGQDEIELQSQHLDTKKRYLVIDDVIATGGTAAALGKLILANKCTLVGFSFLIEISALGGRDILRRATQESPIQSLLVL